MAPRILDLIAKYLNGCIVSDVKTNRLIEDFDGQVYVGGRSPQEFYVRNKARKCRNAMDAMQWIRTVFKVETNYVLPHPVYRAAQCCVVGAMKVKQTCLLSHCSQTWAPVPDINFGQKRVLVTVNPLFPAFNFRIFLGIETIFTQVCLRLFQEEILLTQSVCNELLRSF